MNWSELTRTALKAQLYERETYFREGLADAELVWADGFTDVLRRSALVMVKPEGMVAGKLAPICQFLHEHDFTPVAVEHVTFNRFLWRELWRYQLTSATLDRLAVQERYLAARRGLLLALRCAAEYDLPGTVRLTSLKGSASLTQQVPGTLRHLLGQPNRMLSLLHVADEPADLLRELGLLVEAPVRRRVLARLAAGVAEAADQVRLDDALRLPTRSLATDGALDRVTAAVQTHRADQPELVDALLADLDTMRAGGRIDWVPFQQRLDALAPTVEPWDVVILGTSFIVYDEPGARKTLVNPDPATWRSDARQESARQERQCTWFPPPTACPTATPGTR